LKHCCKLIIVCTVVVVSVAVSDVVFVSALLSIDLATAPSLIIGTFSHSDSLLKGIR
jgi:hypothetical protein